MDMTRKERARRLKSGIPAIFRALKEPETPMAARALAGVTVACALLPMDPAPDFIPVPGYPDDALRLPAPVAPIIRRIPGGGAGALPVVPIWLIVIVPVIRCILSAVRLKDAHPGKRAAAILRGMVDCCPARIRVLSWMQQQTGGSQPGQESSPSG